MVLYLWKSAVYERDFKFLPENKLPPFGLQSVYGVSEEEAQKLLNAGTPKGYKGPVWSPYLWIDVDSYDAAEEVKEKLINAGYEFTMYDSGNKGCHFAVARNHSVSEQLPAKDKEWIRRFTSKADLSIYSHLHLIRMLGARHEKSGRHKELLSTHAGKAIELESLELPEPKSKPLEPGTFHAGSIFDSWFVMNNTLPCHEGTRHSRLMKAARGVRNHGRSQQFALEWLVEINKRFPEQKDISELERIVEYIYES